MTISFGKLKNFIEKHPIFWFVGFTFLLLTSFFSLTDQYFNYQDRKEDGVRYEETQKMQRAVNEQATIVAKQLAISERMLELAEQDAELKETLKSDLEDKNDPEPTVRIVDTSCVQSTNGFVNGTFRWTGTLGAEQWFAIRVAPSGQYPQSTGTYIKNLITSDNQANNWTLTNFSTGLPPGDYSWTVVLIDAGTPITFAPQIGCLVNSGGGGSGTDPNAQIQNEIDEIEREKEQLQQELDNLNGGN